MLLLCPCRMVRTGMRLWRQIWSHMWRHSLQSCWTSWGWSRTLTLILWQPFLLIQCQLPNKISLVMSTQKLHLQHPPLVSKGSRFMKTRPQKRYSLPKTADADAQEMGMWLLLPQWKAVEHFRRQFASEDKLSSCNAQVSCGEWFRRGNPLDRPFCIDCFCYSRQLIASLLARFALVRRWNCSCSYNRQFRFSQSIVYALLLACSSSVHRLFLLFSSINSFSSR